MSKTNFDLVKQAEKALSEKWGYVWGSWGQILTEKLLQQKLKQYPSGEAIILTSFVKHG